MAEQCGICHCRHCGSEMCWADVDAGNEFMEEALQRAEVAEAEVERLKNEVNARKGDPVTRLHKLTAAMERDRIEPIACGHDLSDYCDHCETCGQCRDAGKGKYATGALERCRLGLEGEKERAAQLEIYIGRLKAKLAKVREVLVAPNDSDYASRLDAIAVVDDETEG